MLTVDEGIRQLQEAGAKITAQRVAILKSFEGRTDHPSAEQIFMELKPQYPTLSIATVYSTTQLLADSAILRILSIDDKKVYFDPNTSPHGHFMCRSCKKIIDVPIDFTAISRISGHGGIAAIENTDIFMYGVCSDCAVEN